MSSLLFLVYKLGQVSTQPENISNIICDKPEDRVGAVNRMSGYAEAVVRRTFLLKSALRDFARCRSTSSLKLTLHRRCFFVNFGNLVRALFLQNTTGRLLLIIPLSKVAKEELANETVNYDIEIEAYQFKKVSSDKTVIRNTHNLSTSIQILSR